MQVRDSLRARREHASDQHRVWEGVRERRVAARVDSDTDAMADIYESKREDIASYEREIPYPERAVGMIIAIGGRIASLEAFDSPDTMRKLWGKFVRAAAVDALHLPAGEAVAMSRAVRMLHRARDASFEKYESPGLGEDVRVSGGGVIGSALVYEGCAVHIALFRTARDAERGGRIASQAVRRALRQRHE